MFVPEKQTRVTVEQRYLIRSSTGALNARDIADALHIINTENPDIPKTDDWYHVTTEDDAIVVTLLPVKIDHEHDVTAQEVQKVVTRLREATSASPGPDKRWDLGRENV